MACSAAYLPIMVFGKDYPPGADEDKGLAVTLKCKCSFWDARGYHTGRQIRYTFNSCLRKFYLG